ncbi:hypothetical protein KP509_39G006900 [Ceratopteris richardii]|uniref:Methyltransferase n=1 Tax=Ceratopteris richardii TaxID=49495 RepID=A0A8T2PXY8_CERRI|nr:hypothetical protein KP509_39G006900 [Ceratopteris richardii]
MGKETQALAAMKLHHLTDLKKRSLIWFLALSGLCSLFYMLGAWRASYSKEIPPSTILFGTSADALGCRLNTKLTSTPAAAELDFSTYSSSEIDDSMSVQEELIAFPSCDMKYSEYTPCEDTQRSLRFEREKLIYRERHCPAKDEELHCLIPAPSGYKNPLPWPKSRESAWYANVPHKELTVEKAIQNWIQYEGDRFRFPGGGTMFPKGAKSYIDDINQLISLSDGTIRTALDTGCGVASWGAYLLDRDILTMSFAPRDTHEAQVQFALERGVPAMLGVMASKRMPYPARSFDMAHCSRCLIPWKDHNGMYLIEVDRVLRPGGYWILSGPPINWQTHWKGWQRTKEDLSEEQHAIESLARSLCWKKVAERGNLAVWQKPWNHIDCIRFKKRMLNAPHICVNEDADAAWYKNMETCITPLPDATDRKEVAGGPLAKWPHRLRLIPPRISNGTLPGVTESTFLDDTRTWGERVEYYKGSLAPPLASGRYRNIIDMNANFGGFAAALAKDKVWVMNVVPPHGKLNTLGVIYERGLIGTYQDWCEAFSTYPRTYDFIHADRIFSMYQDRCDIVNILLEMDRILRPKGLIIVRDDVVILNKVLSMAPGLRWETRLADHESGPFNAEKILVAVKTYWVGSPSNSTEQS